MLFFLAMNDATVSSAKDFNTPLSILQEGFTLPVLKICLLGSPQIILFGQLLNLHLSRKAQALLYYLAATGQAHSRSHLAALFWPDMPDTQARKNLRNILPELRKHLDGYLLINTEIVGLQPNATLFVDIYYLSNLFKDQNTKNEAALLLEAVTRYHGDFLQGFFLNQAPFYEEWITAQRQYYHFLIVDGLHQLAQKLLAEQKIEFGLRVVRQLLTIDRLHEASHRLLIHFLWLDGQRVAALNHYRQLQTLLRSELDIEPDDATKQLVQQIQNSVDPASIVDSAISQPTNKPIAANYKQQKKIPNNLPQQLTSFVGRQTEISEIGQILTHATYRLVTLLGEGGVGKTRLALAVAQQLIEDASLVQQQFSQGIWFIPLATVSIVGGANEQLATAVAQALQLRFTGNQPAFSQLLAYLRKQKLLLIMDNAEHLLPDLADFLIEILQDCSDVSVLVTSRHLLNLQAELIWRITGLSTPSFEQAKNLPRADLFAFNSVSLFWERAKRINPKLQATDSLLTEIAAICRQVEGLPLAIELASARTQYQSCAEIRVALQRDLSILASDIGDLLPKHRSIQAVLDYSWQFLNEKDACILIGCTLFEGSFSSEAAQSVLTEDIHLLYKLVDQSLVQLHDNRFSLHELIRQYAATKLACSTEYRDLFAARHATYYIQFLHEMETRLNVDLDAPFLIQKELSNIHVAWKWSIEQGELRLLTIGLNSLEYYYRLACNYSEAIRLFEKTLNAVRQKLSSDLSNIQAQRLQIRLLCHITQFCRQSGKVSTAQDLIQEALEVGQKVNEPDLLCLIYHELARLAQVRSDHHTMRQLAEQAYQYAMQTQLPHLIVETLNDIGVACSFSIHQSAANPYFYEALNKLKEHPNHYMEARLTDNLGGDYLLEHHYGRAIDYLQNGIKLKRRLKVNAGVEISLIFRGELWRALGQYEAARQSYEEAQQLFEFAHNPYWESWLYTSLGRLYCLLGDSATAVTIFRDVQAMLQPSAMQMQKRWAAISLGHAYYALADYAAARDCYQQAVQLPPEINWTYRAADAQAGLAATLLALNDKQGALAYADAALATLSAQGLSGANEPFLAYWLSIQVLQANHDPRTETVLYSAYQALQKIANELDDPTLRHSFLNQVVVNRNLLALAHQTGIDQNSLNR